MNFYAKKTVMENCLDVIGIGAGPFNLSAAALLQETDLTYQFFDKCTEFCWHPGMLLSNTTIQNSFLRDLVSFATPTSSFSFLAFLHDKQRLYEYINSGIDRTSRLEFNQYLQWVATKLQNYIQWGTEIVDIQKKGDYFLVASACDQCFVAKNLIIGTGPRPNIPQQFLSFLGNNCFHNSDYLARKPDLSNKSIAIIGGGQSGAEILLDLLSSDIELPKIYWISARNHFAPIDESNFANEWFTPHYVDYFYNLSSEAQKNIMQSNFLASDGISHDTIKNIYSKLYQNKITNQSTKIYILTSRNVTDLQQLDNSDYCLVMHNKEKDQYEEINCARIILSTGYRQKLPEILGKNIIKHIKYVNHLPVINKDFSLTYDGIGKIFTMNMAKHSHGIGEPNLSIAAWRSSVIVNSLLGYDKYICPQQSTMLTLNLATHAI